MRRRRTRVEMDRLCARIYAIAKEQQPVTVRQVFYRLVAAGAVEKSEKEYKSTVVRLLGDMRLNGLLPWDWVVDNTRWMRKPRTYSSLSALLWDSSQLYRRSLWETMNVHLEVWLEKEALAGVIYQETAEWDVPLMVTRGYPSLSYLHAAAETIAERARPAFLYYLGDHDPSGLDISRSVESGLRRFAPDAQIRFVRLAVTPAQIQRWSLPTRPTKQTDTRAVDFQGESVEVDAIEPDMLRTMVKKAIRRHLPARQVEQVRRIEALERETLESFALEYSTSSESQP